MPNRASALRSSEPPEFALSTAWNRWLLDGENASWSPKTIHDRRAYLRQLTYWLANEKQLPDDLQQFADPAVLRELLSYVRSERPAGRWGNPTPACRRAPQPETANRFWRELRTFFGWAVTQELLPRNPMDKMTRPRLPEKPIAPLDADAARRLLEAAGRCRRGRRDVALVALYLDSGLRCSEAVNLRREDVDLATGSALVVRGKCGRTRSVFFGAHTSRLLRAYLATRRDGEPWLFLAEGGEALTPAGAAQLVKRAAQRARARANVHRLHHTFALVD